MILVGEQHDDPNTHRLEAAVLEGLARRRVPVILSLEMFERDVQPALDAYLAGTVPEEEFLKGARPWPRYATDYRALVEIARAHGWPVVAANVPRRIAADVAKSGRTAVDALVTADRRFAARDLQCPRDPLLRPLRRADGGPPEARRRREHGRRGHGTLLLGAVREGRDDGGVDRRGRSRRRTGARARSSTSPGRSTATSAPAPLSASAAGSQAAASPWSRCCRSRISTRSPPGTSDRRRADYLVYTIK